MAKALKKLVLGGAIAAAAGAWALMPRTFSNKRKNYVPTLPDVLYAHRGLHDAGSGLDQQYAGESGEYIALARRMAMQAGYGNPSITGPIAPENSLAAFAAAAEAGFGIELDVQLTRDGKVVVIHDDDLLRVAGDPRRVEELTYDELIHIPLFAGAQSGDAAVPADYKAPEADASAMKTPNGMVAGYYQHVPLLSDVLRVVDGRVPIIVEFKFANMRDWDDRDETLMNVAADLLEAYEGVYAVESFHPAAMNWYKQNHPEVCRGQLAQDEPFGADNPVIWLAGKLGFNWMSRPDFVAYDSESGSAKMLRLVRSMGALAVAWTVRSNQEYEACLPYFDRFVFESFVPQMTPGKDLAM